MPSRTPVRYERGADPGALASAWAMAPWAWAMQGAAVAGMVGLGALALGPYRGVAAVDLELVRSAGAPHCNRPPLMESSAPVM